MRRSGSPAMSVPFSRMAPPAGLTMPRMVWTVLVLPQPDSPTRAIISPLAREKLTPSTACTHRLGWPVTTCVSPRRTG